MKYEPCHLSVINIYYRKRNVGIVIKQLYSTFYIVVALMSVQESKNNVIAVVVLKNILGRKLSNKEYNFIPLLILQTALNSTILIQGNHCTLDNPLFTRYQKNMPSLSGQVLYTPGVRRTMEVFTEITSP